MDCSCLSRFEYASLQQCAPHCGTHTCTASVMISVFLGCRVSSVSVCVVWWKMLLDVQERLPQIHRAVTHPSPKQGAFKSKFTQRHTLKHTCLHSMQKNTPITAIWLPGSYFVPIFNIFNLDPFLGRIWVKNGLKRTQVSSCGKASEKAVKCFWETKTLHYSSNL